MKKQVDSKSSFVEINMYVNREQTESEIQTRVIVLFFISLMLFFLHAVRLRNFRKVAEINLRLIPRNNSTANNKAAICSAMSVTTNGTNKNAASTASSSRKTYILWILTNCQAKTMREKNRIMQEKQTENAAPHIPYFGISRKLSSKFPAIHNRLEYKK